MGRVSKYKRVKAVDPFCRRKKDGSFGTGSTTGEVLWGTSMNRVMANNTSELEKKRSRVALACKRRKLQRKLKKQSDDWRNVMKMEDEARWDVAPAEKDDFDLSDMVGSLRKGAIPTLDDHGDERGTTTCTVVTRRKSVSPSALPSTHETKEKETESSKLPDSSSEQETKAAGTATNHETNTPNKSTTTTKTKSVLRYHIPETARQERAMNRLVWGSSSLLALHSSKKERREAAAAGRAESSARRQEGESMTEYRARIRQETMQLIKTARREEEAEQAQMRRKRQGAPEEETRASRRERRKAFSQNRKRKNPTTTSDDANALWDDDDDDDDDDDAARFGEQAERPPSFAQVPRGAAPRQGHQLGHGNDKDDGDDDGDVAQDRVRAEQRRMERMRMEVQEQYARIRAAKRANRS